MNAVYNSRWTGTPLAPLLKECGIKPETIEVVFLGRDRQKETLRPKTDRELTIEVPFGRSMKLEDVLKLDPLLAYERNGEPIEHRNGGPIPPDRARLVRDREREVARPHRVPRPALHGSLHGTRLRHRPRRAARRRGRVHRDLRGPHEPQVGRGPGHPQADRRWKGPRQGPRRSLGRRHGDREGRGQGRRRPLAGSGAGDTTRARSIPGSSSRSTWAVSTRASTPSSPAPST